MSTRFPLYINSTSPFEYLKRIVSKKGLISFFKGIYGSPLSKIDNLSNIFKKEMVKGNETIVIGDGQLDYNSARHFGCFFIGICNEFNKFKENASFIIMENLEKLPEILKSIC